MVPTWHLPFPGSLTCGSMYRWAHYLHERIVVSGTVSQEQLHRILGVGDVATQICRFALRQGLIIEHSDGFTSTDNFEVQWNMLASAS